MQIHIDGVEKQTGKLEDDWDFLEPKQIKDPNESKPEDWVDNAKMDDPEDVKPEGWDDIPETVRPNTLLFVNVLTFLCAD